MLAEQRALLLLYPLNVFLGSRRSNIVWRERIRLERRQTIAHRWGVEIALAPRPPEDCRCLQFNPCGP